jgi:hypothetical protein
MRHVTDRERRARLGRRQGLAAEGKLATVEDATRAMTVLHATEPPSPYLSLWARVPGVTRADVDRALHDDRTLVKQLSMRRTLFVFPRDLLPAGLGSAAARVAVTERNRNRKDLVTAGVTDDPDRWLADAERAVLALLADGRARSAPELRAELPELAGSFVGSPDKPYAATVQFANRVVTQLGAEGRLARAVNGGHWRISKPTWTTPDRWLGEAIEPTDEADGYAELVHRWLWTFGPGTVEDIQWWLGSTKTAVRQALATLGAVEVTLDGPGPSNGWLRSDDLDVVEDPEPWVSLLPVLDPTIMGWKERTWYLDDRKPLLFDTAGNAGTSVWVDGRVVGVWIQDADGVVEVRLLEPQPADVCARLRAEAAALTEWVGHERVSTIYPSTAMKDPALTTPA